MDMFSGHINKLIEELGSLPGIGQKTAQRLAFHIINMPKEQVEQLAGTMTRARENVRYCKQCFTLTDQELCPICSNNKRDSKTIMVVENTKDLAAYEKTGKYEGVYHVLHGLISPMNGVTPEQLKIKELLARISEGNIDEVIVATNPTVEGEATAMYLSKLLRPLGVCVTRLAYGVPVGADLEYADEITLFRALEGRREV
jgi:recombination protein RecR